MRTLWLVNQLWFILPVNSWKNRASSKLLVFVDNGDVTTDKKLGLERLQVAVAMKFINFACFDMHMSM